MMHGKVCFSLFIFLFRGFIFYLQHVVLMFLVQASHNSLPRL